MPPSPLKDQGLSSFFLSPVSLSSFPPPTLVTTLRLQHPRRQSSILVFQFDSPASNNFSLYLTSATQFQGHTLDLIILKHYTTSLTSHLGYEFHPSHQLFHIYHFPRHYLLSPLHHLIIHLKIYCDAIIPLVLKKQNKTVS